MLEGIELMKQPAFNRELLKYLNAATTPFHAVAEMQKILVENGFSELRVDAQWQVKSGGRYYLTRNDSSIFAFVWGKEPVVETGLRMIGAHTDSPCLKVKPEPDLKQNEYCQLGVEVYGGALLNPWFDRDLSIAGKVVFQDESGDLQKELVDFAEPVAIIPSLAIHLDKEANNNRKVNPQTDIPPVLFQAAEKRESTFKEILASRFPSIQGEIMGYDLYFYDCQAPAMVGLHSDFIASARLDNLLSCFTGLQALLNADDNVTSLLVCNDHEEVGSTSAIGAQGPMLKQLLQRLIPDSEQRAIAIARSLLVSTDNAHGIHPNFPSKHDSNHGPILNKGPVIKVNANQRYATNSETAGLFRAFAAKAREEVQVFVNRADMGCGSTIGPLTAAEIGVATLDVGVPTFAMHSIRELAGVKDGFALFKILKEFCQYRKPFKLN